MLGVVAVGLMRPTIVLLVVGLAPRHLGPHTPRLSALARAGAIRPLTTVTPAVTCTVQATFMTGGQPRDHGICRQRVAVPGPHGGLVLRQSNRLVTGEKIWEAGKRRDPGAIQSDALTLRIFVIRLVGSDLRASQFCRTWPNRPPNRHFYG